MCARWESKTSCGSGGDSQKPNKVWGAILKGKKSLKGSAMLLSWQHCASPFLQLQASPTENTRCVNRALIQFEPLK